VDLPVHGAGYEHAARVRERLQPGRDVDAVAVHPPVVVDDVAEVDADAKAHAPMLGHGLIACAHHGLDLARAFGGTDDAGLGEEPRSSQPFDPYHAASGKARPERLERKVFLHVVPAPDLPQMKPDFPTRTHNPPDRRYPWRTSGTRRGRPGVAPVGGP
jgi:hypothetical protein